MLQQIKEKYGDIIKNDIFPYLKFLELRKFVKFGPTGPLFVCFVLGIPPKQIGISARFQSCCDVVWNLCIFGQLFFGNL